MRWQPAVYDFKNVNLFFQRSIETKKAILFRIAFLFSGIICKLLW